MADSFADSVREKLSPADDRVVLVAVALALPAAYLANALLDDSLAGFLALLLVGLTVPQVYENHWSRRYEATRAVVGWTVGACALTTATFLGLYEGAGVVLRQFLGDPGGIQPAVAWLGTWAVAVGVAHTVAARRERG